MNGRPKAWTDELLNSPHSVADKADRVRTMFNDIAPRYELVNRIFSAGRDAAWRRKAVALAGVCPEDVVVDIACGTGDLARAFRNGGAQRVVGCDFAHEMLVRAARSHPDAPRHAQPAHGGLCPPARQTLQNEPAGPAQSRREGVAGADAPSEFGWVEADALRLPFADECCTVASCAFGVRNFADLDAGLREMHRVLRPAGSSRAAPGGRAVILEFTRPSNAFFRRMYEFYAHRIMPRAATLVSGDQSGAYRYLPRSVVSFLTSEQMRSRMICAGFTRTTAHPLTLGIVTVYIGYRDGK